MSDRRIAFTRDGNYIPQPVNHIEELTEGWGGLISHSEMDAVEDATWHWHLFTENATAYARDLGRATRRRQTRSLRHVQARSLTEENMGAVGKLSYAFEVKANHELTVEASLLQIGLFRCLEDLTEKAERARIRGHVERYDRVRRIRDMVTNALRGGFDRGTAHALAIEELCETESEDEDEGAVIEELEMEGELEVVAGEEPELEEEIMPDCPSSQDPSMDNLPEPVFAVPEWD